MDNTRVESDLIGNVAVPKNALFGVHTQRALENFPPKGHRTIGSYPSLITGLMHIKQAAAMTNNRIGFLDNEKTQAIGKAVSQVLDHVKEHNGKLLVYFPIHYLHGGGGTSANMNVNEVIANKGEQLLGGCLGGYQLLHPNDDVNLHQSTNDVYPTACHMAIIEKWPELKKILAGLIAQLDRKAVALSSCQRISRTCLQDAVVITYKDYLAGCAGFVGRSLRQIDRTVDDLHFVNLGGTIVGRKEDVPKAYMENIIPALRKVTQDEKYHHAENLFDSAQNPDEMVRVSSEINILARGLIKIAKDFRLLSSGPETGFNEIDLPPVQAGSSIMPGKINPVIPEFLVQACFQVMGNNVACQAALDHGELDLNVWESSIVFNILNSMELLSDAVSAFSGKCIQGFTINKKQNVKNIDTISPVLTRLMHEYGYSKINQLYKKTSGDIRIIKDEIRKIDSTT